MTSPFAILFLAIQNRIASITISDAQAIPWIDQDLMQLESHNGDDRPPVSWPAVTIDIDNSTFANLGENAQSGTIKVCIRLGFPPFSSSSNLTPAPYRNAALYYYDLEQAVHTAMQGWTPGVVTIDNTTDPPTTTDLSNIFGHFIRVSAVTERRNDHIRVRQLNYTISMDDYSTQLQTIPTTVTLNISTNFSIPS